MEDLSVGGTLKDAERRFPELAITRVYLQASDLNGSVSGKALGKLKSGVKTDLAEPVGSIRAAGGDGIGAPAQW